MVTKEVVDYLAGLVYNRHTRRNYLATWKVFIGVPLDLVPIQRIVDSWTGLAKNTIGQKMAALRRLLDHVAPQLTSQISTPEGRPAQMKDALTREQAAALLESAESPVEVALIRILHDSGLRLGSLSALKAEQFLGKQFFIEYEHHFNS